MKKFVTTLSKRLLLLGIVIGASALMTSTAFANNNKSIDLSGTTTQRFALNQAAETFVPAIVITNSDAVTLITAANDIRVVIPAGATNTTWDPADTSITITSAAFAKIQQTAGGAACAASPCTVTVAYADSNKTMIIPVGTDFILNDAITITTVTTTMATFTAQYDDQGLALSTDGDGTADANCGPAGNAACNTQTFTAGENFDVGAATLSSAAAQAFAKNQITTAISVITITDDAASPVINTTDDIRITIPAGSNFIWDNTDTAATIGGGAAAKVDGSVVTYEDANRTVVIPVTTNLAAADAVTVSGLSFKTFSAAAANDNLDFEVANDATVHATDDKTIGVGAPTIASAAAQKFATNQAAVAISAITITEDASVSVINSTDNIRITIPSGSNFIWDNADVSLTLTDGAGTPLADTGKITGCAASPCTVVLNAANFEDSNRTLLIPVAGNFAAGDAFVVSGINYKTFSARSAGTDNLDLEVTNDATVVNVDTVAISVSTPTILSSAAQQFTSGMNTQPLSWTITITEDASVAIIGAANDFTIKIPSTFNMNFDPADTAITVGGLGATVAKVAQSQGGAACANAVTCAVTPTYFQADGTSACTAAAGNCRTMRVPIDAAALAAGDILTVTGASLFNFSAASAADNLELEVVAPASFGTAAVDEDNVTMTVINSTTRDRSAPSVPTNISVSDQGVITWTDPTNSDLKEIEILKGVGNDPVSGDPVAIVVKGIQTWTDSSAQVGQTIKYILRAKDNSRNASANSAEMVIIIAAPPEEEVVTPEPITVTLDAQNESGQSGTATLTEADGQTTVAITTTGGPADVTQPAHIHAGTCSELGDAQYDLTSVGSNASETVLDLTLAELEAMAPLAINIHKSAEEASVYYACGNIAFGEVLEEVELSENVSEEGVAVDETGIVAEEVTIQNTETGASATVSAGTAATVQDEEGNPVPYTGTILPPTVDAEQEVTGVPEGYTVASDVYNVETGAAGSVTFDQPVTLVFPAADDVDTDLIYTMYAVDPATGALSDPVECTVKLSGESKVFECQTSHLSKFVILAMVPVAEEEEEEVPVEEEEEVENPFVDVKNHWSLEYVVDLFGQEIVSGKDSTHFKPDDAITRAEFTKIIVNAYGIEMKDRVTTMPFSDIKSGDWFVTYVDAAKTAGITAGYADGTFKPNAQITRAEALKILLEAAEVSFTGVEASEFKDVKQSEWYAKYVNYAAANDVVKGYADGTFGVNKNITRAETAKVVSLMLAQ